jgi:hypothetical protein
MGVMNWITLPFRSQFQAAMLAGVKTYTCRSKPYGRPGDRFRRFGAVFELIRVWETTLEDVATNYYRQEGCASPLEFVGIWNEIHPRRRFIPSDRKWLHEFVRVPDRPPVNGRAQCEDR